MALKYINVAYDQQPRAVTQTEPLLMEGLTSDGASPTVFTTAAGGLSAGFDGRPVFISGAVGGVVAGWYIMDAVSATTFTLYNESGVVDAITLTDGTGQIADSATDLAPGPDASSQIKVFYDSDTPKHEIIDALQRAKEALIEQL